MFLAKAPSYEMFWLMNLFSCPRISKSRFPQQSTRSFKVFKPCSIPTGKELLIHCLYVNKESVEPLTKEPYNHFVLSDFKRTIGNIKLQNILRGRQEKKMLYPFHVSGN